MQLDWRSLFVLAGLAVLATPSSAVTIDWVTIGDPGNAPDAPSTNCLGSNCGAVAEAFLISKYEVTNAQYAEFLNAKAAADPNALYSTNMDFFGGITRSGTSGNYSYAAKPGFENKPVNFVSFWDAARFTNWMNNGQGSSDTETGAYTLTPAGIATNSVTRNAGAITFLPSENEWYKAAYYDARTATYFDYPTGTDTVTDCVVAGSDTGNSANCNTVYGFGGLTAVGAYGLSASPSGTFDQGGNVREWTDTIYGALRSYRGGAYADYVTSLSAAWADGGLSNYEFDYLGFRVANVVPEPTTMTLLATGLAALGLKRRRS